MKRILASLSLSALVTAGLLAQVAGKPWQEWTKKDVERVLDGSAWAQTQVETDTSEMFFTPTAQGSRAPNASQRSEQGANNQAISITYHIKLLSARPVREAIARKVMLEQGDRDRELMSQLESFVARDFSPFIVVAVTYESPDGRYSGKALQDFSSAGAGTLRNDTYLERNDGKRLFLMDYKAPISDGLGAKFIFPRMVDGEPFITPEDGDLRFVSVVGKIVKLNIRFPVARMVYEGRLGY